MTAPLRGAAKHPKRDDRNNLPSLESGVWTGLLQLPTRRIGHRLASGLEVQRPDQASSAQHMLDMLDQFNRPEGWVLGVSVLFGRSGQMAAHCSTKARKGGHCQRAVAEAAGSSSKDPVPVSEGSGSGAVAVGCPPKNPNDIVRWPWA
eukprot:CAMPEP_0206530464 /NCGR_PEP_ID=MMETSP0325_2-20121206/3193_1 /ASSEMBLY_ACC=CAM_ASM_000347 /TAXON_ID=2866 /ORGANISM="Crypthecodinium cohnii, Strain Seligo" /LENGTH=147 /DNA_ID=CAMNT_0054026537 /DNA_START=132 /DNA_END=571 /DNA_ORIENTATION=-